MTYEMQSLTKEFAALKEVGVLSAKKYAACLKYVEANSSDVEELLSYSSVEDVADSVRDLAR